MKGGVTERDMVLRKQKAANCDAALEWLEGRIDSEKLITLRDILRRNLPREKAQ